MIILPILVFVYFVGFRFACSQSRVRTCIDAYVLCAALAVIIAEATSLFTAYNLLFVSLCWALILLATVLLYARKLGSVMPCKYFFKELPRFSTWEKTFFFLMAGTVLFVLSRTLISPPCSPLDSLNYHLPKAFMYYKNQSIHNFPTDTGHMLYFGPLNAILMSQSQILCFGWDAVYSHEQFLAYIFCMLAIFQITRLLCGDRKYALIAAAMACFMPVAHMQASSTQCDLLVTTFCVIAVYYMIQTYFDLMRSTYIHPARFVLLGLSCGLAAISKLSAGGTLIGLALLFSILLIIKLRKRAVTSLVIVLLCAVLMTGGFWIRNALDWNGDFLPVSYSGSRPNYEAIGIKGVALIAAKAIAVTYASPWRRLPHVFAEPSLFLASTAAKLLGMDVDAPLTNEWSATFTGIAGVWPDNASYPIHSALVLAATLFCIIHAIRKRKWWLLGYTLCCIQAILFTATQYQWVDSFNRYLMPAFMISLPLCAFMLQKLFGDRKAGTVFCTVTLSVMFLLNAFVSSIYTRFIYYIGGVGTRTYTERALTSHEYYPLELWYAVLDSVEQNQYTEIGLTGNPYGGNYIWMRPFAASKYTVRYVNALIRPDLEDPNFTPDCIIGTYAPDSIPKELAYHGARYVQKFSPCSTYWSMDKTYSCFAYYEKVGS